jgi:hypothetical protein
MTATRHAGPEAEDVILDSADLSLDALRARLGEVVDTVYAGVYTDAVRALYPEASPGEVDNLRLTLYRAVSGKTRRLNPELVMRVARYVPDVSVVWLVAGLGSMFDPMSLDTYAAARAAGVDLWRLADLFDHHHGDDDA